MKPYEPCANIIIDGDEYTSGFLGLHWFPSSIASGNQAHYESAITDNLDTILNTQSGLAVLNAIGTIRQRTMFIRPYHPTPATGTFNATASPTDLAAATMRDTTALDASGNLPAVGQARVTGTGAGSNTVVNFTPSIFVVASGAAARPGATADEILLHEMCHGLRQMMGRSVRERVAGNPGMDNYEEFVAIVISNVYQSERGVSQLRQDHHGFVPLTGPQTNPATFRAAYSAYFTYMDIEMPNVCGRLRQAHCAFNPFS